MYRRDWLTANKLEIKPADKSCSTRGVYRAWPKIKTFGRKQVARLAVLFTSESMFYEAGCLLYLKKISLVH